MLVGVSCVYICMKTHFDRISSLLSMILITTDMSLRILFLVAAVLRTSSGTRYLPCEYEYLHKCDLGFVVGFGNHPNDPNMTLYCDVFQVPNLRIIGAKTPHSNL